MTDWKDIEITLIASFILFCIAVILMNFVFPPKDKVLLPPKHNEVTMPPEIKTITSVLTANQTGELYEESIMPSSDSSNVSLNASLSV